MISEAGFASLRRAATLVHAVPTLRVRLRFADRVIVDVAPQGTPCAPTARAVTPCGFRTAVADAWARHGRGERFALCDLPVDVEPAIDLGVPPCGQSFPGEIHRVPLPARYLYVFATTYGIDACRDRADHHLCELDVPAGLWGVGLRHDDATDVTLVYAELEAEHRSESEPATVEILQALMADLAVRQLLDELSLANG